MPIIDDILSGLQIQIDSLWYNLLLSLASVQWSLLRALIMMGYTLELVNDWLVTSAFAPLIDAANASLQIAVTAAFAVAIVVLGITYLLAAFARLRVVEPKSAIGWYLAAALFFSLGPSLYQGMADFRREVGGAFYATTLTGLQSATGTSFNSLSGVNNTDLPMLSLCDNFGSYLPTWNYTVDGLDVALAYLRADGIDIMGYPSTPRDPYCQPHTPDPSTGTWTAGDIPWEWRRPGSYFDNSVDPVFFTTMTANDRAASIRMASVAQGRLLTGWSLVLFGVVEQLVALLLTVAQGLTFLSFGVAVLFAFFKKTEVIAKSVIDLWIELIVMTVVLALIQALVVAFFLAGTAGGNGVVTLGVGLICLIFMTISLWTGVRAVWSSINRLFAALGQATGGAVVSPAGAAAMAASTAAAVATGGASLAGGVVSTTANAMAGMQALNNGATPAQAAGLVFGDYQPIAGAARSLAYLPGVRGTALGEVAEQFTEGSFTKRVARDIPLIGRVAGPYVGAALLTDRDPAEAEVDEQGRLLRRPMLVPRVGDGLSTFTLPRGVSGQQPIGNTDVIETDDGDMISMTYGNFIPYRRSASASDSTESRRERERAEYNADMRGEELEQHISERGGVRGGAESRLEAAADRLAASAAALERGKFGRMEVRGTDDVTGVLGEALRVVQKERGERATRGVDHLDAAGYVARGAGLTPREGTLPLRAQTTPVGLFLDRALKLGLEPNAAAEIARAVLTSPGRGLTDDKRSELIAQQVSGRGISEGDAERDVRRLERSARLLPDRLNIYGERPLEEKKTK